MNLEKDILRILENEISIGGSGLHSRIQNRLIFLGAKNNFSPIKEYLHANPFQSRRGRVDVYWESKRVDYAIEIDLSLRKKSLQKLISLQAVAQPIWILLAPQPVEVQHEFLKKNDCFGFVHVIGMGLLTKKLDVSGDADVDHEDRDLVSIEDKSLKDAINKAISWEDFERNLGNLGFFVSPKGGGLVFTIDGMSMKASSLGKSYGFNALCKKFGFPPKHLTPNGYTTALGRPSKE